MLLNLVLPLLVGGVFLFSTFTPSIYLLLLAPLLFYGLALVMLGNIHFQILDT
jgi:hypothetical protein